jgi:predicted metal-dependent hydrolase
MDRFMVIVKNNSFTPKDSRDLVKKALDLCSDLKIKIRDARISNQYIQFDISIEKSELKEFENRITSVGELFLSRHIVDEKISKEQGIRDGAFYFNEERFWESHESWEGVWKTCTGDEKSLLQGIILVAVAFAHYQKFENSVCIGMLGRALEKLTNSSGMYHDIDIDMIKDMAIKIRNSGKIHPFKI